MSDIQNTISAHVTALQQNPNERYLLFKPVACGLGGQITGRVQTLMFALATGRKAIFLSVKDAPYGQTFKAMNDVPTGINWENAELLNPLTEQTAAVICYDPMKVTLHTHEIDAALLAKVSERIGMNVADRLTLEGAVFNWMQPTDDMRAFCDAAQARLGVTRNTLGIHFRRGDKAVETAFVPASEFNRQIALLHKHWAFDSVFLASDSPHAKAEITLPAGVKLIFDEEEQRYNNANHKMLIDSPELADQETRVAFKNIALLAACGGVVGQDNAHFATLSGGSVAARDNRLDRVALIDGRFAEKKSPLLAHYFSLKMKARAVARTLLPHMTTEARMKRKK